MLLLNDMKEEHEVSGAKNATAHFVWRCGFCRRESSAKFEPLRPVPYSSDNGVLEGLLVIDCRGLEFTDFDPRVGVQLRVRDNSVEESDAPLCLSGRSWHIGNMEMRGNHRYNIRRGRSYRG